MPRWWLLATRNWSASPGRTLASLLSIALGVGTIVTITSFYETARRAVTDEVVTRWLGSAHISIHPPGAHWGNIDSALADRVRQLDNVVHVTSRLQRRMQLYARGREHRAPDKDFTWIDAYGITPETEEHFRSFPRISGRTIQQGEREVIVLERETANWWSVGLGEHVVVSAYQGATEREFEVVGLLDAARIADFQQPIAYLPLLDLQELNGQLGSVSAIDVKLKDVSPDAIDSCEEEINKLLSAIGQRQLSVETAASRQLLLDEADRITRFSLIILSGVSLLTSFFIILTTMSMSLFERQSVLGVMRCVGMRRAQLAFLIFLELLPVGAAGTLMGVGGGLALAKSAPAWTDGAVMRVLTSHWGVWLGVISGMLTTVLSAAVLTVQVCRVSPLTAVTHEARPANRVIPYIVSSIGLLLLIVHEVLVNHWDKSQWIDPQYALVGVGTIFLGYILLAPAIVVLTGPVIARVIGPLLGLRAKLAVDQFGRAPWRSTGVCWVLMVGLSLILYIGIGMQAIVAVWDFPARLPEAFVWSRDYVPGNVLESVRRIPGVSDVGTTTDVECQIGTPDAPARSTTESLLRTFMSSLTRPVFVAADPDRILSLFKVAYIEGSEDQARAKIKKGGFVYIPLQTSQNKNLHVGDRITITIGDRSSEFEIAAVVQSPALDIAVNMFQATSYMQIAAASAILGTHQDLRERFGLDIVAMIVCNLDLPPSHPPDGFDPLNLPDYRDLRAIGRAFVSWRNRLPLEEPFLKDHSDELAAWLEKDVPGTDPENLRPALQRFARAIKYVHWAPKNSGMTAEDSWQTLRERLVMLRIAETIHRPGAIMGSLSRMKTALDQSIRRATIVLTWLPSVLLLVAAIGIGNLMMVSVQIRARQLATLRAVGAVKSQVFRLVLAEAISLGLVGSVIGLTFGFHEAWSDNRITTGLIGFRPEFIVPWGTVSLAVLFSVTVCLAAGLGPAKRAARSNIIEAMQVI